MRGNAFLGYTDTFKTDSPKKLNTEPTDVGANVNKVRQKPTTTVKP